MSGGVQGHDPLQDHDLLHKAFGDAPDVSTVVLRVKPDPRSPSPGARPTIWHDYALQLEQQELNKSPRNDPDNAAPRLSAWDRSMVSPINLLTSTFDYRLCPHCKRPFLTKALPHHIKLMCTKNPANAPRALSTPAKRQRSDSFSDASIVDEESTPDVPKKRKYVKKQKLALADANDSADLSSPEKKARKSKKEKLPKSTAKTKGPVDVEKQCGVPLPGGGLCARSLTCKTHSMGAKRAVQGRSAPYDILLTQYQRKNQVKLASLSTAQQLADENEALGGYTPLNPDEEVQQVLEGVRFVYATPLERKVVFPTRLKSQFFRMREMFANALLPKVSGPSGIGRIIGRANAFHPDNPSNLQFLRPPALQRQAYLQQLRQQQQQQQQQQQPPFQSSPQTQPTQQQQEQLSILRQQQLAQAQARRG